MSKEITECNKKPYYSCIISLGFFCSVAIDSETLHHRSYSFPFDWFICVFEKTVISAIDNHFKHFFDIKDFKQADYNKNHFYNNRYDYWSYHDFTGDVPLRYQFVFVKRKIKRRIKRLNYHIKNKKCLFIRYCKDQEEIEYINTNIEKIKTLFGSNGSNILFVCNEELNAPSNFYKVKKDINDSVNRTPLFANKNLNTFINENVALVSTKKKRISVLRKKVFRKYIACLRRIYR